MCGITALARAKGGGEGDGDDTVPVLVEMSCAEPGASGDSLEAILAASDERDVGTLRSQAEGHGAAQATCCARDDGGLT